MIGKGNYGKKTDDDLLGENVDMNETLGGLSDLEGMKMALENLRK